MKDDTDSYFCHYYRPQPQVTKKKEEEEHKIIPPEKPKKGETHTTTVTQKQKRSGPSKKVGESLLETIFKEQMRANRK